MCFRTLTLCHAAGNACSLPAAVSFLSERHGLSNLFSVRCIEVPKAVLQPSPVLWCLLLMMAKYWTYPRWPLSLATPDCLQKPDLDSSSLKWCNRQHGLLQSQQWGFRFASSFGTWGNERRLFSIWLNLSTLYSQRVLILQYAHRNSDLT